MSKLVNLCARLAMLFAIATFALTISALIFLKDWIDIRSVGVALGGLLIGTLILALYLRRVAARSDRYIAIAPDRLRREYYTNPWYPGYPLSQTTQFPVPTTAIQPGVPAPSQPAWPSPVPPPTRNRTTVVTTKPKPPILSAPPAVPVRPTPDLDNTRLGNAVQPPPPPVIPAPKPAIQQRGPYDGLFPPPDPGEDMLIQDIFDEDIHPGAFTGDTVSTQISDTAIGLPSPVIRSDANEKALTTRAGKRSIPSGDAQSSAPDQAESGTDSVFDTPNSLPL